MTKNTYSIHIHYIFSIFEHKPAHAHTYTHTHTHTHTHTDTHTHTHKHTHTHTHTNTQTHTHTHTASQSALYVTQDPLSSNRHNRTRKSVNASPFSHIRFT